MALSARGASAAPSNRARRIRGRPIRGEMPVHRPACLLIFALALFGASPAAAFGEGDWPCVQRKVARLSWGQIWAGPPLPEDPLWREDTGLVDLVPRVAARRTDIAEVETLVAGVGPAEEADRDARLVNLFAGAFDLIDRERTRIIAGIERYARTQRALSEKIDARRAELTELEANTAPDDFDALDRLDVLRDELAWDIRIFQERRRSLTYVCETPVLLEKRAFAIGRVIQAELGD